MISPRFPPRKSPVLERNEVGNPHAKTVVTVAARLGVRPEEIKSSDISRRATDKRPIGFLINVIRCDSDFKNSLDEFSIFHRSQLRRGRKGWSPAVPTIIVGSGRYSGPQMVDHSGHVHLLRLSRFSLPESRPDRPLRGFDSRVTDGDAPRRRTGSRPSGPIPVQLRVS